MGDLRFWGLAMPFVKTVHCCSIHCSHDLHLCGRW